MKITRNKNILEKKCDLIYFSDGINISRKLLSVCFLGKNKDCIGLAHNQIGGDKRVCVAKLNNKWRVFINIEIVETSVDYIINTESCMSFPNKFNKVKRYNKIIVKHQVKARNNNNGNAFITEEFSSEDAYIMQHEIDHLDGISYTNRMSKLHSDRINKKMKKKYGF